MVLNCVLIVHLDRKIISKNIMYLRLAKTLCSKLNTAKQALYLGVKKLAPCMYLCLEIVPSTGEKISLWYTSDMFVKEPWMLTILDCILPLLPHM